MTERQQTQAMLAEGREALERGDVKAAERVGTTMVQASPDSADGWLLLGEVANRRARYRDAVLRFERALAQDPTSRACRAGWARARIGELDYEAALPTVEALYAETGDSQYVLNMAQCAWGLGRYDQALAWFEDAAHGDPPSPEAEIALAQSLTSLGRVDDAVAALERSSALAGGVAPALCLLAMCRTSQSGVDAGLPLFERAAAADPAHGMSNYGYAVALALAGHRRHAQRQARPWLQMPQFAARWEGFAYMQRVQPDVSVVGVPTDVLLRGIEAVSLDGPFVELGVYRGRTLRLMAERTAQPVHGFDSFHGLPEDWGPRRKKGTYSTNGVLPETPAAHVRIHEGLFGDTLPAFTQVEQRPAAFVHVDCDIYASTHTALEALSERIVPGTVLVFDEYLGYPDYRQHEYRAFQEHVQRHGLRYAYCVYSLLGREVAVRIESGDRAPNR